MNKILFLICVCVTVSLVVGLVHGFSSQKLPDRIPSDPVVETTAKIRQKFEKRKRQKEALVSSFRMVAETLAPVTREFHEGALTWNGSRFMWQDAELGTNTSLEIYEQAYEKLPALLVTIDKALEP